MDQNKEAYERYRSSFPSDSFMHKYFGGDVLVEGNPCRGEISENLYKSLRHLFDGALRGMPEYHLKARRTEEGEYSRVYVFKDGRPEDWVDPTLEKRGLMLELPPEAFTELCREFIVHCQAGALHHREWWQWQSEGESIWIEVVPEAIATGKDEPRSLAELLKGHTTQSYKA